ncbi:hypothetical protein Q5N86_19585, partial [Acinetobacter baumannii]|nr:hypothetical protein [Acinetobacter baumannii]
TQHALPGRTIDEVSASGCAQGLPAPGSQDAGGSPRTASAISWAGAVRRGGLHLQGVALGTGGPARS